MIWDPCRRCNLKGVTHYKPSSKNETPITILEKQVAVLKEQIAELKEQTSEQQSRSSNTSPKRRLIETAAESNDPFELIADAFPLNTFTPTLPNTLALSNIMHTSINEEDCSKEKRYDFTDDITTILQTLSFDDENTEQGKHSSSDQIQTFEQT